MACALGIEQPCSECGLCGNSPTWRCKMAKCKYPNEVCGNMTVYHGVVYCDSVPCSLKDELPKRTNADRIREMTNEELAELLERAENAGYNDSSITPKDKNNFHIDMLEWLKSECDTEC